ncbi:MAG: WD40 repeat domain-containing protein [Armatimonadota bacterium]
MKLALIAVLICLAVPTHAQQAAFTDHGVGAPVAESRGFVAAQDANGSPLLIALSLDQSPRGWILLIEPEAGETEQFYFPEGVGNSAPFASLMSENGRFYTVSGRSFMEFDPAAREWLFHGIPPDAGIHVTGSAVCDGPGGRIFAGMHQNCQLISYDPQTQQLEAHGRLDEAEQYVNSLFAGPDGWLYAGIGTARQNVVAMNPETGQRVQIPSEDQRVHGSGGVRLATDGNVYGRVGDTWWLLRDGDGTVVAADQVPPPARTGAIGWGQKTAALPDGSVATLDLPERRLTITPPDGEPRLVRFDYESEGASITSLAAGPDGNIYASTSHPMHLVRYDPRSDELTDLGHVPAIGGGNMCAMTAAGDLLYGAEYSGGRVWSYDPALPWQPTADEQPNPRELAQYKQDLCRPRACIADADERWVVSGGFAGYGLVGGGLAIHDRETGETVLLSHEDVIEHESTITMRFLPDGNLVGGTSVAAPGGGHPQAEEGTLYILDWQSREVIFRMNPVEGAREVFSIEVGPDGLVYGLASGSQFFVFDPSVREIVHREDLSGYGALPRQTLTLGPDGNIYATFSTSIVRITPGTFEHQKLADPPGNITAGAVILDGRLYYASGSHVWSYDLET